MADIDVLVPDVGPAKSPAKEPITGRYVILKPMVEADFPSLWSSVGKHDEVFTHFPDGPYTEPSQFTDMLKALLSEAGLVTYTVFRQGEAQGCAFFLVNDLGDRVAEMGALYGPSLQKTPEATEAMYLIARLAFDTLNNRRVGWKTNRVNKRSQAAAERWGLVYEGCLRQHGIQQGRNRDTVWYSMIDKEWPICKRAFEAWLEEDNFDEQGRQKRSLVEVRRAITAEHQ